jgi:hypothetical protein
MATAHRAFFSWTSSGEGNDLGPGQAHGWWAVGFDYGDPITVTAHPVSGAPWPYELAVESVRMQSNPGGGTLLFRVRNVGTRPVPGYGVGFGWVKK